MIGLLVEANLADLKEQLIKENRTVNTVPVIWDRKRFIGGYNELMDYIESTGRYG